MNDLDPLQEKPSSLTALDSQPPVSSPSWTQLVTAILMSLFICPGLGHRYLGRNKAYKIVLALFFGTFFVLALSVYSLAHKIFSNTQENAVTIQTLNQILSGAAGKAFLSTVAFGFLIVIYIAAPIELVVTALFLRKEA